MNTTPFLSWDLIHPGAVAWMDNRESLACDVPRGVELRVNPAAMSKPIIVVDKPWEEMICWAQVMQDQDRYRLWYGVRRKDRTPHELLCYAESDDGFNWTKPELGLLEVDGSFANNVVSAADGVLHFCIVKCPDESPDKRYRCMLFRSWWEGEPGQELDNEEGHRRLNAKNAAKAGEDVLPVSLLGKMLGMNSPDGLNWTPIEKPILDEWHDTHNICVYDTKKKIYRAYLRGGYGGRRAVAYSETKDFENWPPSRLIHHHVIDDGPNESLYSNCYTPYPGRPDIHLMFPAIFHQGSDTTYGQLAVSMNGINWSRFTRQVIIPHGAPGEPHEAEAYPEPELLRFSSDGKFRLVCRCGNRYHNQAYNEAIMAEGCKMFYAWAEWAEDRLAGIHATDDGEFTVKLQTCGDRMLANFRTEPGGWVKFEFVDRLVWPPQQWPGIEGFRFEDMENMTGDSTHAPVKWNGNADLSAVSGRNVGVRVKMHKATIFSVTMYGVDEPLVQEDMRFPV